MGRVIEEWKEEGRRRGRGGGEKKRKRRVAVVDGEQGTEGDLALGKMVVGRGGENKGETVRMKM